MREKGRKGEGGMWAFFKGLACVLLGICLNCYSRLVVDGEKCYHLESEIYA